MAEKQKAGRDLLGEFAPKFAELNDDVLFGEVWPTFNIAKEIYKN
ncbi:alkylhydroperoxidase/carboxymuconolactone decarboxylase family protein YurZ [Paenibacillus castaneae]|nr:alkylhydroperoxidase/carboxymuconolactone decarboxylase family protein YurZ [Paenibacillus castaneae]